MNHLTLRRLFAAASPHRPQNSRGSHSNTFRLPFSQKDALPLGSQIESTHDSGRGHSCRDRWLGKVIVERLPANGAQRPTPAAR
jgi:hypothetical protein